MLCWGNRIIDITCRCLLVKQLGFNTYFQGYCFTQLIMDRTVQIALEVSAHPICNKPIGYRYIQTMMLAVVDKFDRLRPG